MREMIDTAAGNTIDIIYWTPNLQLRNPSFATLNSTVSFSYKNNLVISVFYKHSKWLQQLMVIWEKVPEMSLAKATISA